MRRSPAQPIAAESLSQQCCMKSDLDSLIRAAKQPIPESEILNIAQDFLRGLAHCHAGGSTQGPPILHRDLKPPNSTLLKPVWQSDL